MPEKKTFTHIAVNNNYLICQDLGKNISKTSANGINMFCHIKESRGFFIITYVYLTEKIIKLVFS